MHLCSTQKHAATICPRIIYRVAQKRSNIRILCNRVVEVNQQKSTFVMSKSLRICLYEFSP